MKKNLLGLVLLMATAYAYAGGGRDHESPPSPVGGSTSFLAAAAASSISGASGGNASASSGPVSVNSTFHYDGDRNPVNSAFGYAPPPTADCQAVFGGGAQGVNIGLSISGSYDDSECNKRAWAA